MRKINLIHKREVVSFTFQTTFNHFNNMIHIFIEIVFTIFFDDLTEFFLYFFLVIMFC